ncbi:MAG: hypothetical protein RL219_199 [Actinomycetota bacterium]
MTHHTITDQTAGTGHRTRLAKIPDIAFRHCGVRLTHKAVVDLCDGLNIQFVRKQGAPAWAVRALGDPDGPFPGRFNGTEALTDDGLTSLLNYLSATAPEAA